MTNFLIKISLSILVISGAVPAASAQSNQAQDTVGSIGNLFGALAMAGAKSKAQKGWAQISEPIKACLNTTLESKKITVEQLVAAGIAPSNDQVAQLVTSCNQIMAVQLQTNIPCNVTNSKGQQVQSTCSQVFAKEENGQIFEVSRDDFLRAAGNGEKVQIATLELSVANSARLAEEQRLAEAERQRFLASSEGKRQAALEASRIKAAENAAKSKAAAVAANASASKKRIAALERQAPPLSQALSIANSPDGLKVTSIQTCKVLNRIQFLENDFKVIGIAPAQLSAFAVVGKTDYVKSKTTISFSNKNVIDSREYSSTTIKGFEDENFSVYRFVSYNTADKSTIKDQIGRLEFSFISPDRSKIGETGVFILSMNGVINSENEKISYSNSFAYAPLNVVYRSSTSDGWDHFIGACRTTYVY